MTLDELVAGDAVFVDANIFTYHFQPHPILGPACWPFAGIGNRLRTNPIDVQTLTVFRLATEKVLQGRVVVLPVLPSTLAAAVVQCHQLGLLTNDGLILATMQAQGLTKLASHDADFDRVPGITRYALA
jgi:predicted nucleic acid-binding protein